jgi:hypothetical protein
MTGNFAAAGLAEAAWAMAACIIAAVILLLVTLFFEPWQCFSPFEEADYADPDVRVAGMFRTVGVTCVAAVGSVLFAFLWPKKGTPTTEGSHGPV